MNNAQIAAAFIDGQRLLQSINGENIILAGQTSPCLPADLITGNRLWEPGGASQQFNITVSILKEDLPAAPATNTLANFRGLDLRVSNVNDADTFWTVELIQENA
jgi:hypothetical protein